MLHFSRKRNFPVRSLSVGLLIIFDFKNKMYFGFILERPCTPAFRKCTTTNAIYESLVGCVGYGGMVLEVSQRKDRMEYSHPSFFWSLSRPCCLQSSLISQFLSLTGEAPAYLLIFILFIILIACKLNKIVHAFFRDFSHDRSMCPNISAALHSSGHGYLVQGSQDSTRGLFILSAAPLAGAASDRFGRKPVIFISLLFLAVPAVALAITCRSGVYIPLYTIAGIFESAALVSANAYIVVLVDVEDGSKSKILAQIYAIPFLSVLVGAPLGGLAAQAWQDSQSDTYFALIAALSVLPAIFTLFAVAEPPPSSAEKLDSMQSQGSQDAEDLFAPRNAASRPACHLSHQSPNLPCGCSDAAATPAGRCGSRGAAALLAITFLLGMESSGVSSLLFNYLTGRFPECAEACRGAYLSALAGVYSLFSLLLLPLMLSWFGPLATLRISLAANVAH